MLLIVALMKYLYIRNSNIYLYNGIKSTAKLEINAWYMIIGGALGNYIDRITRGYVVDFLDFYIWPVFNIADVFVVVGCGLLIISSFKFAKNK